METHLPDNPLQAIGACDKDSFPNIQSLPVIACTLPISNAEAERSRKVISLLRQIGTYLRYIISEEHCSIFLPLPCTMEKEYLWMKFVEI